ncbi:MAG: hypothetical protein KatS3mg057_2875 [Herpetosiphonaceae bacterium]|nr:MAG: hypothetical protein KatS3mg057_2875 [Herpetosiphonaceae bacterium]
MAETTQASSICAFGRTDRGRQRNNNEDRLFWRPMRDIPPAQIARLGMLYIIADGVGGNQDGEKAAEDVIVHLTSHYYHDTYPKNMSRRERLNLAIQRTTRDIFDEALRANSNRAATLVAALIWHEGAHTHVLFANVGDSPAFLFRASQSPSSSAITTVDHVRADLSLWQSMGDMEVEPSFYQDTFEPGDVIVLCSDGLSDLVSPEEIGSIALKQSPREAANDLINLANLRRGHDNITTIVIRNGKNPLPIGLFRSVAVGAVALAILMALLLFGSGGASPVFTNDDDGPLFVAATDVIDHQVSTMTVPAPAARTAVAQTQAALNRPTRTTLLPDTDGDGVTDSADHCPNQIGAVTNAGCPVRQRADEQQDQVAQPAQLPAVEPTQPPTAQSPYPPVTQSAQPTLAQPTNTPKPTSTPEPQEGPASLPEPTYTLPPTSTPKPSEAPTSTPEPTYTPKPTSTPKPTYTSEPTSTPRPKEMPEPTLWEPCLLPGCGPKPPKP